NPPDNPARLALPADWRVLLFGFRLIILVVLLLGLLPALRASAVRPVAALKGGEDPHSPRRLMRGAIALQVAFCCLVLFLSSLFVASFQRLQNRPLGFSTDRLLLLATVARKGQLPVVWNPTAEPLRADPRVAPNTSRRSPPPPHATPTATCATPAVPSSTSPSLKPTTNPPQVLWTSPPSPSTPTHRPRPPSPTPSASSSRSATTAFASQTS